MNLVEIKDFGFSYPESSRKVLEHVNLNIKRKPLNVIMGRSGCGKSTLLRQLKSVLAPAGEKRERSSIGIFRLGIPTTAHRARRSGL